MATVKNTVALQDKTTPVLRSIIKALNSTINAMASVDHISDKAFKGARNDINLATAALNNFNNKADDIPAVANQGANALAKWKNPLVTASALIYTIKNAIAGIGNLMGVPDSFNLTLARLDLMKGEFKEVGELQDFILASANRSRSAYDGVADSVAKLGLTASKSFSSTEEIVAFTELMNKSFKVGGADTTAQTAGMYQLTQAMASGKLQGDEYRSIIENAPLLANSIEDYMKNVVKAKGTMKDWASEGLLTADVIKAALFSSSDQINQKFESLPKSFGDAWVNIKNQALESFQPVFERLSGIVNSPGFQEFLTDINTGIKNASIWIFDFIGNMQQLVSFATANWPLISDIIVGALTGIGTAYVAAQVGALLYAFAQGLVNIELLILYARLAGAAALVAGAVILWNNFGVAGKVLAIILGVLAAVILTCTIAQYAFNASLWANPIVWVVALIVALIAIIVVLVLWIIDLWQTNMDFKYGVIKIWNSILNFFDQVPIFFQTIGNAIANVLGQTKVSMAELFNDMANNAIDTVNDVIRTLNKIPGVSIGVLDNVSFAGTIAAEEEAKRQSRDDSLQTSKDKAAAKAAERQAKADADRAVDEKNLAEKRAKAEAEKNKKQEDATKPKDTELDFSKYQGNPTGGKLDSVGRINDDVSITDEDIKLLKDVAKTEFINKYTTLTPNLKISFGDVHETADTNAITAAVETMILESLSTILIDS